MQRSRELLVQQPASLQAEQGGGGGFVRGLHSLNAESGLRKSGATPIVPVASQVQRCIAGSGTSHGLGVQLPVGLRWTPLIESGVRVVRVASGS